MTTPPTVPPAVPVPLSEHLQNMTEALAAARIGKDVFAAVLPHALAALNAVAGAVLLVDETGTRLEIASTQGYEQEAQTLWQDGPLDGNVPAGDALSRHEALFFEQEGDLKRAYPELEARTGGVAAVATAVLPMFLDDQALGTIILDFQEPHEFTPEEDRFLRTLAAQCAVALGRARLGESLEARVAARTAELEGERAALDAFVAYKEAVGGESDVPTLARQAARVLRANLEHVSVAYYEREGGLWKARVWSQDVSPEVLAQIRAGVPEGAPNFAQATHSGEPVFADSWNAEADGLPGATVYGAAAFVPLVVGGAVHSLLAVGTREARAWTEREQALVRAVARGLRVTLERTEHLRQLDEERAALAAFARFTEASTHTTDALTLARGARDVLRATLGMQVGYSELEGGVWKGRVFSENTPPEVVAQAQRGFPADLPSFARPFMERDVVFVDGWNAHAEGADHTGVYTAAALYPYFEEGQPHGLLTIGSPDARAWTERERSVFRAVGRSLALAFERAEQTRRLEAQNAELEARTRALEGFARLTQDLVERDDPRAFVRRAQEVILSLLPPGYALYYERDGERWRNRVQVGDVGNAELQAFIDAGPPVGVTPSVDVPWTTRQPFYQDAYAQGSDTPAELVQHVNAAASLPVFRSGETVGVLIAVLFEGRAWTRTDRAVLETVVGSLGMALERVAGVAELEARTREVSEWRERYEVAVRGSGHLLYDWDPATDAILYGGAVEGITGYTVEELDGNLADWTGRLIHPDDREAFAREIARVIASGDEFHLAFRLLHKSGSVRDVEDDGYFKRDERGGVTRMVGLVKDVTERKRAEEALVRQSEELRRSNGELEQFAYIASHDLQAPIRAVTSFAGVIDKRYGDQLDERGRLYLRQIVESGEHMKRLVDDLLAFSRVHTQRRELSPVDSGVVFDAVLRRLSGEIEAGGADVTRGDLPVVRADAQQLDQLFQNLITNGLKYHREGVPPQVHVTAEREGEMWRFVVRDNGIGIEGQYHERIFVIFQRLHGREAFEGTGIGLAVCKKIVERHGGRLWVESVPGEGSTFSFTLPGT